MSNPLPFNITFFDKKGTSFVFLPSRMLLIEHTKYRTTVKFNVKAPGLYNFIKGFVWAFKRGGGGGGGGSKKTISCVS